MHCIFVLVHALCRIASTFIDVENVVVNMNCGDKGLRGFCGRLPAYL